MSPRRWSTSSSSTRGRAARDGVQTVDERSASRVVPRRRVARAADDQRIATSCRTRQRGSGTRRADAFGGAAKTGAAIAATPSSTGCPTARSCLSRFATPPTTAPRRQLQKAGQRSGRRALVEGRVSRLGCVRRADRAAPLADSTRHRRHAHPGAATEVTDYQLSRDGSSITFREDATEKTDYDVISGTQNHLNDRASASAAARVARRRQDDEDQPTPLVRRWAGVCVGRERRSVRSARGRGQAAIADDP